MPSTRSFLKEVEALSEQYLEAYRRRDAQACAEVYADDAVVIASGGGIAKGRQAIAAGIQASLDAHNEIARLTTTGAEADGPIGYATQIAHSARGAIHVLVVMKRDSRGVWRVCAEAIVGNS